MAYPERVPYDAKPLDLPALGQLTFANPDYDRFPCLKMAQDALREGGNMPVVLNGANEEAVAKFLRGDIPFGDIYRLVEKAMERLPGLPADSFDDVFEADRRAREVVREAAG
jgi:1-deoxy-D-xylulose-5-phosphate reductoisomerase